ncbi:Tetratricopeptide-like helical domain containing protein [Trema orientale]|uniref:Tetratricopeptide-like helical domain containing protein n=1 Tax=Trema orientale TaxID=63057 RepID=A0A2P5FE86_TREOI|nr:Tetratricopeptide-like helical domain containing protein [Trema orientale]
MHPKLFSQVLIRNARNGSLSLSRFYYTNRSNKATLYSRISPLGDPGTSVVPELDEWVQKGKRVRVGELQRIIHDLRKRKRFSQALEMVDFDQKLANGSGIISGQQWNLPIIFCFVNALLLQISEWMNKKGVCIFSPTEHAVQLDLIGRVHGFASAESYFNNLKEQDKTEKTYGALLNCYVRQRQTDKSLSHLQKMKEIGFASSPLTYNDIMCLYVNLGQHEKVPDVLAEMKENKVAPDNFSYRICMNSYGVRSDLEGMEKVLKEMESQPHIVMDWNTYTVAANIYIKAGLANKATNALKKSEERLDKKDATAYNQLISLHASLGNKEEVLRLWDLLKSACKRCINKDYIITLDSLVRLGELEEAQKVLEEWQSSENCYDFRVPNSLIVGYAEKGQCEKAETLLENLVEKGRMTTPNSWGIVAAKYLEKDETQKALDCIKAALSHCPGKVWKPNPRVTASILSWLGDKCSVEEVEAFVDSLRTVVPVNRHMYHALLKAHIRDGRAINALLDGMKAEKIDEDEETKNILAMRQNSA